LQGEAAFVRLINGSKIDGKQFVVRIISCPGKFSSSFIPTNSGSNLPLGVVCAEKPFEAHNQPVFRATAIAGWVVQIFENLVGRTSNKRLNFES
jgi:hypothetical protein